MAHALILGASGISGWSLLNQARSYPTPTTFARITGTTNRPLTLDQTHIPNDPRVHIASGIDFTKPVEEVARSLKEKIPDVKTVSHVFYTAYVQTSDFESLKKVNIGLLDVAVRAIEAVSSNLQVVILQTGGKGYGLEFPKDVAIRPPLKETHPRIPEPWASNIFYYGQYDLLKALSHGKPWTFSEIRPDGIVGFTPSSNAMNMAQGIGLYLTIYREVHGAGAAVPFPGYEHGYHAKHSDTFQDILSKMEIYAALNPDKCGDGGVFNIADGKDVAWADVWPRLCEHFGLVGQGPVVANKTPMLDFVKEHRDAWSNLAKRYGLKEEVVDQQGWAHTHFMLVPFDFDRQYDLSRSREVGFSEEIDTVEGYILSWDRMRAAKILPPL
ncbi:Short chain dehydrogenase sirQ [Lasiodiplodia theobromae]|uniref:Short chain dehydrogenase sirQ n=1 Tax=Lasiodiplodia theobromae TaxID=45133 RepID=A0A5N5CX79_9PEZI|nr:Short chain dehydrogenase sirQ [Lasiodiplodia theobromae]